MIFGSVCSGIEAASVAWKPLGWKAAFVSEIEAFPRAVLAHHYPETPLHGDFTTIQSGDYQSIDLLVGGTPCQSFSVAGLRGGLDDDRGQLALEYLRLADRLRPRWLVWENVPGVLSSSGGRDFGSFLGGLAELGYGFAYRVLDAQYFGVAQRRRRVFVVGHLGDWRRAAAVLFERHSLQGHPSPRREAREGSAADVAHSLRAGGFDASEDGTGRGTPLVADTLRSHTRPGSNAIGTLAHVPTVSPSLKARDYKGPSTDGDGDGDGAPLIAFSCKDDGGDATSGLSPTLRSVAGYGANGGGPPAIAFGWQNSASQGDSASQHITPTLDKSKTPAASIGSAVRRLTPRECERLQGFPDDYTMIPWRKGMAPDGPRYKALGNSMAVPVMRWIGERIAAVDQISLCAEAA